MLRLRVLLVAALLPLALAAPTATLADTGVVNVNAVVLLKTSCTFNTASRTMNFGNLNPASTTTVTRNSTYSIRCNGSAASATFAITTDSGLYETAPGAYRMRNTTNTSEFLSYSLSTTPQSATIANNTTSSIVVTGTVTAANYQSAAAGTYNDRVTLTISP